MHDGVAVVGRIVGLTIALAQIKLILAAGSYVGRINCDVLIPITAGVGMVQANSMKHLKRIYDKLVSARLLLRIAPRRALASSSLSLTAKRSLSFSIKASDLYNWLQAIAS